MCIHAGSYLYGMSVASLPSDYTNLPSTPQRPLLVYALAATCWIFQRITLHFSLHCFIPIRKKTVAVYKQKHLGKHNIQLLRKNCLPELQLRDIALTLVCIPLKIWGHQIHRFASGTSSKKETFFQSYETHLPRH